MYLLERITSSHTNGEKADPPILHPTMLCIVHNALWYLIVDKPSSPYISHCLVFVLGMELIFLGCETLVPPQWWKLVSRSVENHIHVAMLNLNKMTLLWFSDQGFGS